MTDPQNRTRQLRPEPDPFRPVDALPQARQPWDQPPARATNAAADLSGFHYATQHYPLAHQSQQPAAAPASEPYPPVVSSTHDVPPVPQQATSRGSGFVLGCVIGIVVGVMIGVILGWSTARFFYTSGLSQVLTAYAAVEVLDPEAAEGVAGAATAFPHGISFITEGITPGSTL